MTVRVDTVGRSRQIDTAPSKGTQISTVYCRLFYRDSSMLTLLRKRKFPVLEEGELAMPVHTTLISKVNGIL